MIEDGRSAHRCRSKAIPGLSSWRSPLGYLFHESMRYKQTTLHRRLWRGSSGQQCVSRQERGQLRTEAPQARGLQSKRSEKKQIPLLVQAEKKGGGSGG